VSLLAALIQLMWAVAAAVAVVELIQEAMPVMVKTARLLAKPH
jgi:hypothetical protein